MLKTEIVLRVFLKFNPVDKDWNFQKFFLIKNLTINLFLRIVLHRHYSNSAHGLTVSHGCNLHDCSRHFSSGQNSILISRFSLQKLTSSFLD